MPQSWYSRMRSMHLSGDPVISPDSGMDANSVRTRASCSLEWVGASRTVTDNRRVSGSRPADSHARVRKVLRWLTCRGDHHRTLRPWADLAALRCDAPGRLLRRSTTVDAAAGLEADRRWRHPTHRTRRHRWGSVRSTPLES